MLALLSNGGSSSTPSWDVPEAGYEPNEELVDVVSCTRISADSNGGVSVQGSDGNPQVCLRDARVRLICALNSLAL